MKRLILTAAMGLLLSTGIHGGAQAQRFDLQGSEYVQNDWVPNQYRVFCGTYNGTARNVGGVQRFDLDEERDGGPCFSPSLTSLIRTRTSTSMAGLREMGFRAPPIFGPRMEGDDSDGFIRLYESTSGGIASTRMACGGIGMSAITFGQGMREWEDRPYLVNYFIAHELFHVIQHAYPVWQMDDCGIKAGWIAESTADAVATELTRRAFPHLFPSHGSEREIQKFAGLRRYDSPLNVARGERTETRIHYLTSSFWRHLAETYNGGKYEFIHRFFRVRPDDGDWLGWLNRRLQSDPAFSAHLSLVYPIFVADFANWGRQGYPGEAIGQEAWLVKTFGGCHTIDLSPEAPSDSLEVSLNRTSAQCVRVRVSGVGPGDRTSVKVAAVAGNAPGGPAAARFSDQLHLSLAATTDRTRFNCAKWSRRFGMRGGAVCLFVPDTGAVRLGDGTEQQARTWRVRTNEAGPGEQQQIDRGASFTNTYMISRVAVDPTENPSDEDGGAQLNATFYFAMDVSRITASPTGDKTRGNTGAGTQGDPTNLNPNRQRSGGETRTVGTLNMDQPALAQEALPIHDAQGNPVVTYTNPSEFRPPQLSFNASDAIRRRMNAPDDGLFMFQVSQVRVERANPNDRAVGDISHWQILPMEGDEPRFIRIGETGTFDAAIMGGTAGRNAQMFGSPAERPARLEIVKHTRNAIHLRVTGVVCRYLPPPPGPGCHNGGLVKAELIKAFPAAYTPSGRFTAYDTPGTAIYRTGKSNAFRRSTGEDGDDGDGPQGSNGGDGSPGSAAVEKQCDCSCEGFERFQERVKELKKARESGGNIDMGAMMKMTQCMQQCAMQYGQCKRR